MTPILEVRDLGKRYGTRQALDGVSFDVQEGEMFGLLGPNGAGKTTLLSIVSSLLEPSAGEVRLLGRMLTRSDRDLRRQLGIVPQDLAIYAELTPRENLRFFGGLYGIAGDKLERRVNEVLEATALADRADQRVATFSGGMKRRLNLGAALIHEPTIILLDEPTTGVDPQSRNHIFTEVRRLNKAGVTIVYTSHYMEEVQSLCTRIGIIDHGKLVACDTLPALLQQLAGAIHLSAEPMPPELAQQLGQLPDVKLLKTNGTELSLECRDVQATLPRVVAVLQEMKIDLTGLDTQEPNLERVFLHLTGRGLRD